MKFAEVCCLSREVIKSRDKSSGSQRRVNVESVFTVQYVLGSCSTISRLVGCTKLLSFLMEDKILEEERRKKIQQQEGLWM